MKILFYIEPLIEMEDPYWKSGWASYFSMNMVNALAESDKVTSDEYVFALNEPLDERFKSQLDNLSTVVFSQTELLNVFDGDHLKASKSWYLESYSKKQMNYYINLMKNKFRDFIPDIIITYSPVPFLKKAYPKALILYKEYSIFSRKPFPESWYLDPCGMYGHNYISKYYKIIIEQKVNEDELEILNALKTDIQNLLKNKSPFGQLVMKARKNFDYLVLLPLQFSGYYAFDSMSKYQNQFHYVDDIMSKIPDNIAVFVTVHPNYNILQQNAVDYLRLKYPNFIYDISFEEIQSASQFLLAEVDAIITVSSSVGIQSLLFDAKLISIGQNYFHHFSDGQKIEDLPRVLKKAKNNNDAFLFWFITRYTILKNYLTDSGWLRSFLTQSLDLYRKNKVDENFFNPVSNPKAYLGEVKDLLNDSIPEFAEFPPLHRLRAKYREEHLALKKSNQGITNISIEGMDIKEKRRLLLHLNQELSLLESIPEVEEIMNILVITHNRGAVAQVRILSPLKELFKKDLIDYRIMTIEEGANISERDLEHIDLLIFQRIDHYKLLEVLHFANKQGIKTVYEIDDNLLEIPPHNANYSHYRNKDVRDSIIEFVSQVHELTVTTDELKKYFSGFNKNISVLPNQLDTSIFKHKPSAFSTKKIRIGFAGTITHKNDLQQVIPALKRIKIEYFHQIQLVFIGYIPDEFKSDPDVEFLEGIDHLAKYAKLLDNSGLDIGLAPLNFEEFNKGKSDVKFLEYSALKIAGIYSKFTPYLHTIQDGVTGLFVEKEDPDEWYEKIKYLVENTDKLTEIKNNAYDYVYENRIFSVRSPDWYAVYTDILKRKIAEIDQSQSKMVSIIIPVFNKMEFTKKCIQSIVKNTVYTNYEIILIDNGSTDRTKKYLNELIKHNSNIVAIHNEKNLGFAKANNIGVKHASGEYLLFLNNDTEVKEGWLSSLVNIIDNDSSVGAVGSKLVFPDGKIQHAGVIYVKNDTRDGNIEAWHIHYKKDNSPDVNISMEYQALTAASLLIPKALFESVKGFDEAYWNGYEDVDLCMKISQSGARLVYEPKSEIIHYESQSGEERFRKEDENLSLFQKKWSDSIAIDYILRKDGRTNSNISGKIRAYSKTEDIREGSRSIIIVTYNSDETIEKCLLSLFRTLNLNDEIILVDNKSSDKTCPIVQKLFQGKTHCKLIENQTNMGFSEASNIGVRNSNGKIIVFLNPDTIVSYDWLNRLEYHLRKTPDVAAVGPISNYAAGMQNLDKYVKSDLKNISNVDVISEKFYTWYKQSSVDSKLLTGFCLMIFYSKLKEVGFLDSRLFLGNDDLDLSWKLRLKHYKLMVAPDVFIYHIGQHSFKKSGKSVTAKLVQESTDILYDELKKYYGEDAVPTPEELWGIKWFRPGNATFNANAGFEKGETKFLKVEKIPDRDSLVSIIMLTFNAIKYTQKAIKSIQEHTHYPYEIIFVDNGSTDGSVKYLRKLCKKNKNYKLIENKKNKGFAAGNNQGVQESKGKFICLLNNDILVADGWLTRLLSTLNLDKKIGMVGPLTNYISGRQMVKNIPYKDDSGYYDYADTLAKQFKGKVRPRRRIAGFAVVMEKSLYQQLGGFDESYGTGNFEDDDLCLRVQKEGFSIMVDESTFIHHYGSRTFKDNNIDYSASMKTKGQLFKQKWPDIDYNELLEIKDGSILEDVHNEQIDIASNLLINGDTVEAESVFLDILKENPLNANALFGLALTAKLENKNGEAMILLRRVLDIDPDYVDAYNQSGIISFENGEYESARLMFIAAIEKDPGHIEAQKNLAEVLLILEEYEEGIGIYMSILKNNPNEESVLLRMAELYYESGDPKQAKEFLDKVMGIIPENDRVIELNKLLSQSI